MHNPNLESSLHGGEGGFDVFLYGVGRRAPRVRGGQKNFNGSVFQLRTTANHAQFCHREERQLRIHDLLQYTLNACDSFGYHFAPG